MENKKKIVVLTGAGMSAESGLATFRDSNGLWAGYNVEEVASIDGFIRNPALVLDFYNQRRREALAHKPNKGHQLLAKLEEHYDVSIITQNVDNYHEYAGSNNVIHLHGELMKSRSVHNPYKTYDIDPQNPDIRLGDLSPDGEQLRPFIVWFGEAVPMFDDAIKETEQADIFIVIGTSLNVYPAAGLLNYVPRSCPIYLIDPKEVHTVYRKDIKHIQKGACEGMQVLYEILCK